MILIHHIVLRFIIKNISIHHNALYIETHGIMKASEKFLQKWPNSPSSTDLQFIIHPAIKQVNEISWNQYRLCICKSRVARYCRIQTPTDLSLGPQTLPCTYWVYFLTNIELATPLVSVLSFYQNILFRYP